MDNDQARDLLMSTRRGDPRAAAAFCREFSPGLLAYARSLMRHNEHAAEDVVQSVFMAILNLPDRRSADIVDVAAWLVRTTRNTAMNAVRGRKRSALRERLRASHDRARAEHPGPSDDPISLRRALDELEDGPRELMVLRHVTGLTFEQMALVLDVGRDTLVSRYRAAMKQVQARVDAATRVDGATRGGGQTTEVRSA